MFGSPEFHRNPCGLFRPELKNCMLPRLLKCFSHAWNHAAVAVTQTAPSAVQSSRNIVPAGSELLRRRAPIGSGGARRTQLSTGRVRLKVGVPRVSSGTCACDTAPPAGPGTAVSRSAAGKGARAGQWHWLVLGGPELACGPESPSEPGRSRRRGMERAGFILTKWLFRSITDK